MARSLSDDQARFLRLRAQRLHPQQRNSIADVAQVVKELCGVQAQDASAAALTVRARSAGLTASDVERARLQERSLVRTWCMRGTLHLLATQDIGWLLPLLGPIFVREGRRRRAELGLDEDTCARGIRAIRNALANRGPLTRAELADHLTACGIRATGQGPYHLVRQAALEGIVCVGPDRDNKPTYALLDDWVKPERAMSRDAAQAELARRYLEAYGPAAREAHPSRRRVAAPGIAGGRMRFGTWGCAATSVKTVS